MYFLDASGYSTDIPSTISTEAVPCTNSTWGGCVSVSTVSATFGLVWQRSHFGCIRGSANTELTLAPVVPNGDHSWVAIPSALRKTGEKGRMEQFLCERVVQEMDDFFSSHGKRPF